MMSRGKIEKYARLGMSTPKGMVIDTEGNERTDTEGILLDMVKGKCALCPMGGAGDELAGYKGYGWCVVLPQESLCFLTSPGPLLWRFSAQLSSPANLAPCCQEWTKRPVSHAP
jgi:hypothetical protein